MALPTSLARLSCDPHALTDRERRRLLRMFASYLELEVNDMNIVKVEPTNSTRITIELPETAATKLVTAIEEQDPRL